MQTTPDDPFWDLYWQVHLQSMETLGKREAILAASRLIRSMNTERPVRLLELGCGEGQIIGTLIKAHAQDCLVQECVGIDYLASAIHTCRRLYPGPQFIEGDFTDPALLTSLGKFDILLCVNALHEVFSDTYAEELGQVDEPFARRRVESVLADASGCVVSGGWVVLFDGLEPSVDLHRQIRIRFLHAEAREQFETFSREYRPFRITYQQTTHPLTILLSWRDFTRYITKSIFLGKRLWEHERDESYQYFTLTDFQTAFQRAGLYIHSVRMLTENYEKWSGQVCIETPGDDFPAEHILIVAQKQGN